MPNLADVRNGPRDLSGWFSSSFNCHPRYTQSSIYHWIRDLPSGYVAPFPVAYAFLGPYRLGSSRIYTDSLKPLLDKCCSLDCLSMRLQKRCYYTLFKVHARCQVLEKPLWFLFAYTSSESSDRISSLFFIRRLIGLIALYNYIHRVQGAFSSSNFKLYKMRGHCMGHYYPPNTVYYSIGYKFLKRWTCPGQWGTFFFWISRFTCNK